MENARSRHAASTAPRAVAICRRRFGETPHDAPTRRTLTHDELVNVPAA